jgi:3-hydroxyisobutyrate dehydrogenase
LPIRQRKDIRVDIDTESRSNDACGIELRTKEFSVTTVGVIGLGNMGRGMALSLQRGGLTVLGTDASEETRRILADDGVEVVDSIAAVAARADIIVLSLPTAAIVTQVVTGPGGLLASARPGVLVVDTSTSHPDTTRQLARQLAEVGMSLIDAPVSGGPKGAITGQLTMVLGGSEADVARAEPVLATMSAKRVHVGGVGAGHVAKIANNLMCAAHLIVAGEVARLADSAGVTTEQLLEGINAGSGRSGITQVNYPTWILNGAFNSGFTMKLMRKDVRLAAELIGQTGLQLPLAAEVARLWASSAESIGDDEDFNRIVELGTERAKA